MVNINVTIRPIHTEDLYKGSGSSRPREFIQLAAGLATPLDPGMGEAQAVVCVASLTTSGHTVAWLDSASQQHQQWQLLVAMASVTSCQTWPH